MDKKQQKKQQQQSPILTREKNTSKSPGAKSVSANNQRSTHASSSRQRDDAQSDQTRSSNKRSISDVHEIQNPAKRMNAPLSSTQPATVYYHVPGTSTANNPSVSAAEGKPQFRIVKKTIVTSKTTSTIYRDVMDRDQVIETQIIRRWDETKVRIHLLF
jgi:hypothetical protein